MDTNNDRTYKHQPFNSKTQIRLLCLGEDVFSSPSSNALRNFDLDSLPPYVALSYVWGSPTPAAKLAFKAGGELNLTQNLADFLGTVPGDRRRAGKLISWIWIDALCIDQANIDERNEQVRQMHAIYTQAVEVLAWLGAASEDSDAAAEFVSLVANKLRGFDSDALSSVATVLAQPGFPQYGDERWKGLLHLLCRPWFRRIWVQQEAILASSITFICGHSEIKYLISMGNIIFTNGLNNLALCAVAEMPSLFRESGHSLRILENLSFGHQFSRKKSLLDALFSFQGCVASDPRDKVYGVLGLSFQPGEEG